MYYLNCMCTVLDLNDTAHLDTLTDHSKHYLLSEAETDALISLCFLLSPDQLSGKVIFESDEMCGNSLNEFFELSAVQNNLLISESILIGGQRRAVHKIMAFKKAWLQNNWLEPMQAFASRLARIAAGESGATQRPAIGYTPAYTPAARSTSDDDDCCCAIL